MKTIETRTLATAALAGLAGFALIVALLNIVQRANYSMRRQAISELALGRGGTLMIAAFLAIGLALALTAVILRRSRSAGVITPTLLGGAAVLGGPVSAAFHADQAGATATVHGNIHDIAGLTAFLFVLVAMFLAARRFRRDPAWRRFATPTLVWAIVAMAALLLIPLLGDAHFGIAQRVFVATFITWLAAVNARAVRTDVPAEHERREAARTPSAAGSMGRTTGTLCALAAIVALLSGAPTARAAASTANETLRATIVASGASGERQVVASVIVGHGVFTGAGRIVEQDSLPSDPADSSRDDLVFASGTLHIISLDQAFSFSLDPKSCMVQVAIDQVTRTDGGTGKFAHADGTFSSRVAVRGLAERAPDGSCSQDQALSREVDKITATGTLTL